MRANRDMLKAQLYGVAWKQMMKDIHIISMYGNEPKTCDMLSEIGF